MPLTRSRTLTTCLAAITLASCATSGSCYMGLDMEKIRGVIRSGVADQMGLAVKDVICPESRGFLAGDTFECTVIAARGARITVTVTQKTEYGRVSWKVKGSDTLMASEKLEPQIADFIRERLAVVATVDCGARFREIEVGKTFECRATDSTGAAVPVIVTMKDPTGKVDWRLSPSPPTPGAQGAASRGRP